MEKILEKILEKLENLENRMDNMDKTLIKQEQNLEYHIKRSDQADAAIKIIDERVKPIEDHVKSLNTVMKTLNVLAKIGAGIGGFILFILAIVEFVIPLFK